MAKKTLKLDKDLNLNVKHSDFYLEHTIRCPAQVHAVHTEWDCFSSHTWAWKLSVCFVFFTSNQTTFFSLPFSLFVSDIWWWVPITVLPAPPPCWHEPTPDTKECCRWEQSQVLWRSDSALHNLNSPIFFPPSCCRICAWSTHFSNKILRIKIGRRKKKNGLQSVMK